MGREGEVRDRLLGGDSKHNIVELNSWGLDASAVPSPFRTQIREVVEMQTKKMFFFSHS